MVSLYKIQVWRGGEAGAWETPIDAPVIHTTAQGLEVVAKARERTRLLGPSGQVICDSGAKEGGR